MPTISDNLATTAAGYAAALAADSVSPQPSYSLDGKAVSRQEWRDGLQKLVVAIQQQINGLNPYCVVTRKSM